MTNRMKDSISFKHLDIAGAVSVLDAKYTKQKFCNHTHDGYAFGVITDGQLNFSYLNKKWQADKGDINLVVPGEVHDGYGPNNVGWSYKMIYLEPKMLKTIYAKRCDKDSLPWFNFGVVGNNELASSYLYMHETLLNKDASLLEKESLLISFLTSFIELFSSEKVTKQSIGYETKSMQKCLMYIHDNYLSDISIKDLANVSALSESYLIRAFKKNFGMAPHQYLQLLKINKAKKMLIDGIQPAFVASALGFTDQSHFSRTFKLYTGLTPGVFKSSKDTKYIK